MFIVYAYLIGLFACAVGQRWNFVFIVVDDLRDALGCYGDTKAHTPNIDRLSTESAIFMQAFAQQALCAPSRNSILTSRRPDTLRLYDFYSYWRNVAGNFTTLPQHLKNFGYRTKSIGKVFHPGVSSNGSDDSPYSWTDKPFHPYTNRYKNAKVCSIREKKIRAQNLICPVKVSDMPMSTLPDLEIVEEAEEFLKNRERDSTPFFLAVGFQKPHIPLKYPEKYLKYHPLHKFNIPHPYKWPTNISDIAYNPWIDLRKRDDVKALNLKFPWQKIPAHFGRRIIQSYYAAVTYIDDLIGKILHRLETTTLRENTIVLLTSDHGWSLGEHAVWAKYSNFQVATKVPLLLSVPGVTFSLNQNSLSILQSNDSQTDKYSTNSKPSLDGIENYYITNERKPMLIDSIVELIDIFPTIADFAGVPIPPCQNHMGSLQTRLGQKIFNYPNTCTEGVSLMPLINFASDDKRIFRKNMAFWQYPRPGTQPTKVPNSDEPRLDEIVSMGYTVRTNRYRYTAWVHFSSQTQIPDWNQLIAEELYDLMLDSTENHNVVTNKEYFTVKQHLWHLLQSENRHSLLS